MIVKNKTWERFSDEGYKHYYVIKAGYKYNMMDIQAAIGIGRVSQCESGCEAMY